MVEVIVAVTLLGWNRPRPVTLVLEQCAPSGVMHEVRDGEPRNLSWRCHEVDATGLVYARHGLDLGSYRPSNPHPLTVVRRRLRSALDDRAATSDLPFGSRCAVPSGARARVETGADAGVGREESVQGCACGAFSSGPVTI
jgi:hypothetical protein